MRLVVVPLPAGPGRSPPVPAGPRPFPAVPGRPRPSPAVPGRPQPSVRAHPRARLCSLKQSWALVAATTIQVHQSQAFRRRRALRARQPSLQDGKVLDGLLPKDLCCRVGVVLAPTPLRSDLRSTTHSRPSSCTRAASSAERPCQFARGHGPHSPQAGARGSPGPGQKPLGGAEQTGLRCTMSPRSRTPRGRQRGGGYTTNLATVAVPARPRPSPPSRPVPADPGRSPPVPARPRPAPLAL